MTGHEGSDGTTTYARLDEFSDVQGHFGVSQAYGQKTALDVILKLLIDDGVPSRGHRLNILNKELKDIGSYSSTH